MKVKINVEKGETLLEAEEKLEKALKAKKECSHGEQYCDPAVNEFHDFIESKHKQLVKKVLEDIKSEIQRDVNSRL